MAQRFAYGKQLLEFQGGEPVFREAADPSELVGAIPLPEETLRSYLDTYNARPERKAKLAEQAKARDAEFMPQPSVSVEVGMPTIQRRIPQRPGVAVSEGAKPDTSGMMSRISGIPRSDAAMASAPSSIQRLVSQAAMGAAMPEDEREGGDPAVPPSGPQPSGLDIAHLRSGVNRVGAKLGNALEPLKAALMGRREDDSRLRSELAEADRPVAQFQQRSAFDKMQAEAKQEAALRNPNSPESQRAREIIAAQLGPERAAAVAGMSAAEIREAAPNLFKRVEAAEAAEARAAERRAALEARGDERDEQRAFQAEQNRLSREASRENAQIMSGFRRDQSLERDVEGLSKRLEGAPALRGDLSTLNKYAKEEDIPGVGKFDGRLPEWMQGQDGTRVRQAAKGVVGTILKERSGTAASDAEVERLMSEMGMGPGATEQEFREGLQRVTEITRGILRTKEAAARPEALQIARQRGITTSVDLPGEADHSAAVKWAQDNPGDPRAVEILRRNGVR